MSLLETSVRRLAAGLCFIGAISGCAGSLHIPPSQPTASNAGHGRQVSGEGCGFQLMAFFPIGMMSRNERAYAHMLDAAQGDPVADIRMQESWTFAVVGWKSCTTLTGTAYPRG